MPGMKQNRFEPPHAALLSSTPSPSVAAAKWVASVLGVLCMASGAIRVLGIATTAGRIGLSVVDLCVLCATPFAWALLGYFLSMRSRHALAAAVVAVVVGGFLIGPWVKHLVQSHIHIGTGDFDYIQALDEALHKPTLDWLANVVVIGFCLWDYRQRFATWRTDLSQPEPDATGDSMTAPE